MPPIALNGKRLAEVVTRKLYQEVSDYRSRRERTPGLAVVLVGEMPASLIYVGRKAKVAAEIGFETFDVRLEKTISQQELLRKIEDLNQDDRVDGILVQLPLPPHIDPDAVVSAIAESKDVDGLHPVNQGLLVRGQRGLRPCTPEAVLKLIDLAAAVVKHGEKAYDDYLNVPLVDLTGRHALVVGRSALVGKPTALMLLERNATVTIAHSKTLDIAALCSQADIVVSAVGRPQTIKASWLRCGSVAIDVGTFKQGSGKLVGDFEAEVAHSAALAYTPVPGGVGPMTVAMLMVNTLTAFKKHTEKNHTAERRQS